MQVIPVDVAAFTMTTAVGSAVPVVEFGTDKQKANADGEPLFAASVVFGLPDGSGSVVSVRFPGPAPVLVVGAPVTITGLTARLWEMGSRRGVTFSAASVSSVSSGSSGSSKS